MDCRHNMPAHVLEWMASNLKEQAEREFGLDYDSGVGQAAVRRTATDDRNWKHRRGSGLGRGPPCVIAVIGFAV